MRILALINSLGQGGAERSLLDLSERMATDWGITTQILTMRQVDHGFGGGLPRNLAVDVLPRGVPRQLARLRRLLGSGQYDLIWTTLWEADLLGRLAAFRTGIPVLCSLVNTPYDPVRRTDPHVRGWKLDLAHAIDGWSARHLTTHFHAISEAVAEHAVQQLGIRRQSITVIARGRSSKDFEPITEEHRQRIRAALGVPDHSLALVNVARHEFQKGQKVLVEAMAALRSNGIDVFLVIAGRSGNETASLERLIASHRLEASIKLLGDRRDVPEILRASDLFVFPSLYEGLGGALIEAMAAELPIVASRLPAISEVVDETAVLVPAGDATALAAGIAGLAQKPDERRRRGSDGRSRFLRHFTLDRVAADMADLLRSVAERRVTEA